MRARTQYRLTRALLPLLAAALAVAWPAPSARAAAYTYSSQQRTVNAGILLVDDPATPPVPNGIDFPAGGNTLTDTPGASNPDPYVFYILNQRNDLKPFGWNIVNPLAPPAVTGDIQLRWNGRPYLGATNNNYALNEPVTPDMAAYWEVSLSKASLPNLLQYDVLLINLGPGHTSVAFTDDEVHKLRRFVDAGGQLLVECSGGNINGSEPLFFPDYFSNSGGQNQPYLIPATSAVQLRHPIIAAPYLLTPQELNGLGNSSYAVNIVSNPTPFDVVLRDSQNGRLPALVAEQYGAGQVIMDATGSLATLNDSVPGFNGTYGTALGYNGASNSGPRCEGPFTAAPASDLKLLADILSWTGAHPNEHKNSHQSSQSPAVVGPALSPTWTFPAANAVPSGTALPNSPTAPGAAINGNFVYVRDAFGVLHAFSATPGTDILGTGDPDAGYQDFDLGQPYDEIWATGGVSTTGASGPHGFPNATQPVLAFQDPYASAPTVAAFSGTTYVFIEDSTGKVFQYNATDGTGSATPLPNSGANVSYASLPIAAPAPTFFDGRLYAGQPDGTLYVYNFSTGVGLRVPFQPASAPAPINPGPVLAPPTVGIVRQNLNGLPDGTNGYSDDIIAAVTTTGGVYTLELGSRHDPLLGSNNVPPTPITSDYTAHGAGAGAFKIDFTTAPHMAYDLTASGYILQTFAGTSTNGNGFSVTSSATFPPPFYGNYDVDFADAAAQATQGTPQYVLNRAQFAYASTAPAQTASVPALGANGNLYYTANLTLNNDSSLVCAHDTRANGAPGAQMQWRFRLPFATEGPTVDADGVSYDNLAGFRFFGAPVVDRNDNVFALAYSGTKVAVLCLSGDQRVTAQVSAAGVGNAQVSSVMQTVIGKPSDEFGNPPVPARGNTQYDTGIDNNGQITFRNFGFPSIPGSPALVPNLGEPEPVSVTYTVGGSANGGIPTTALLHTNLLWYTILPSTPVSVGSGANLTVYTALPNLATLTQPTSGLTLVGNYLYYGDGNGNLVRVYAYPQNASLVTNRYAALSPSYMPNPPFSQSPPINPTATVDSDGRATVAFTQTGVGAIGGAVSPASFGGVPSAGSGVLIANGTNGVAAFGSQNTIVADANRVVELDAEGVATWAVDATTQIGLNNVATHLDLSRPSGIAQIAANDYLVADTGNNRCVRFDRSGSVLWELTHFNDTPFLGTAVSAGNNTLTKPNRLLAPGEPTTLSRPASVDSYTQTFADPQAPTSGYNWTAQHYLIADTGHYRVLEVVDVFDQNGKPVGQPHNLVWISHTYDVQHRQYSYTGANYYHSYASGQRYVAGLISNVRVAPLTAPLTTQAALPLGALAPAASDAPGASLVLLDYDPDGLNPTTQRDGYIGVGSNATGANELRAFSTFQATLTAPLAAGGAFDLTYDSYGAPLPGSTAGTKQTLYLRNPRSLQTYTNKSTNGVTHFLLADDNGVFDLVPNQSVLPNDPPLLAVWGFTQGDYRAVGTPIDAVTLAAGGFNRAAANIPFIPTSLSRPSADTVGGHVIGHYLVTNGYSQGQVTPSIAGQPATYTIGGEVLELHAVALGVIASTLQTQEIHGSAGPFSGTTLSKPGDTSPLSQPAFAAREK